MSGFTSRELALFPFISKPFHPAAFREKIATVMKGRARPAGMHGTE
jgi:hypothetical protein